MYTIACVSAKGGVGKTSSVYHLAGTMAKSGRRVLAIDADPQASLTQGILGTDVAIQLPLEVTIASLFAREAMTESLIHSTPFDRLWLLPSHLRARRYNNVEPEHWIAPIESIADLVDEVNGRFDVVFIDAPPNLHYCAFASLWAASHVLIPVQAEDFGARGMIEMYEAIDWVQRGRGGRPEVLGILISMFKKQRAVQKLYEANIRSEHGAVVLDTVVPDCAELPEAVLARHPISHYKPKSPGGKVYTAIVAEMDARLASDAKEVAA